jgi:hypothetical protein
MSNFLNPCGRIAEDLSTARRSTSVCYHLTSPLTWRQKSIPEQRNAKRLAHLDAERSRSEVWEAEADAVIVDEHVLEADDVPIDANRIFERCHCDHDVIHSMCSLSERDFLRLSDIVSATLTEAKRGRKQVVGPIDGFFLLLCWLRKAVPIGSMAVVFQMHVAPVYKTRKKITKDVHEHLIHQFILKAATQPVTAGENFLGCGLIADATVQWRGRPIGEFEEARLFFSGKQQIDCITWQVMTNREGMAEGQA